MFRLRGFIVCQSLMEFILSPSPLPTVRAIKSAIISNPESFRNKTRQINIHRSSHILRSEQKNDELKVLPTLNDFLFEVDAESIIESSTNPIKRW